MASALAAMASAGRVSPLFPPRKSGRIGPSCADAQAPAGSAPAHEGADRQSSWCTSDVSRDRHSTAFTVRTSRKRSGPRTSSGCFRMTNDDVVDLYNRVSGRREGCRASLGSFNVRGTALWRQVHRDIPAREPHYCCLVRTNTASCRSR